MASPSENPVRSGRPGENFNIRQVWGDSTGVPFSPEDLADPSCPANPNNPGYAEYIKNLPPQNNFGKSNVVNPYNPNHDSAFNPTLGRDDHLSLTRVSGAVQILINDLYVDYVTDPGDDVGYEANNLIATLESFGLTVGTFTDVSDNGIQSILNGTSVIFIPELENEDEATLNGDVSEAAKAMIADWVNRGGNIVMFAPGSGSGVDFVNSTFDFELFKFFSDDEPIFLTEAGNDLGIFSQETISLNDATESIASPTLPEGGITVYEGSGDYGEYQSIVSLIPYGEGKIFILGWDWYDAAPIGEQDGGWLTVLNDFLQSRGVL